MIKEYYSVGSQLIDCKLAPHTLEIGSFCYCNKGWISGGSMDYRNYTLFHFSVRINHTDKGTIFKGNEIKNLVKYCQKVGFTPGKVTKQDLFNQ